MSNNMELERSPFVGVDWLSTWLDSIQAKNIEHRMKNQTKNTLVFPFISAGRTAFPPSPAAPQLTRVD